MDTESIARELFFAIGAFQAGPIRRVQELSQGEMAMLGYLILTEGPVTPTDLSQKLRLTSARIANALNSLEKKNYIRRVHDNVDRRKVFVTITDLGRQKADESMEQAVDGLKELLGTMGEEDSLELVRLMKKAAALIQNSENG